MVIALALAVAAGFLIKDAENQPVILHVVNYMKSKAPMSGDVVPATGDVVATGAEAEVPTAEVATGTEVVPATGTDVATGAEADVATGTEVATGSDTATGSNAAAQ